VSKGNWNLQDFFLFLFSFFFLAVGVAGLFKMRILLCSFKWPQTQDSHAIVLWRLKAQMYAIIPYLLKPGFWTRISFLVYNNQC
jgi:MFS-type transporter involved in bile tolerance (Atg22 family)